VEQALGVHGFDGPVLIPSTPFRINFVEGLTTGRHLKDASHPVNAGWLAKRV